MWITLLKKIWWVNFIVITLWCQRIRQAPDENGEGIKGSLRVTFFTKNFSNVDKNVEKFIKINLCSTYHKRIFVSH
jgi:hypothetical protein